jgi:hypothetical protein
MYHEGNKTASSEFLNISNWLRNSTAAKVIRGCEFLGQVRLQMRKSSTNRTRRICSKHWRLIEVPDKPKLNHIRMSVASKRNKNALAIR